MLGVCPMGVANKLFPMGVLVTTGGVEYGRTQPEMSTAVSISVEAITTPRFKRAICISSTRTKSFDDGSTSLLARQAMRWEIGGIPRVT
jgi:hypothetical protein